MKTEVNFSAATVQTEGGFVLRTGKVFEVGDYPDKEFSLSDQEADTAVSTFAPVNANLEHRESLVDGYIGGLKRLWKDGKELFGEIAIPQWLDAIARDRGEPVKPSLEWDRDSKKVVGIAYTLSPRISDAALMAAFSLYNDKGAADNAPERKAPVKFPALTALFRKAGATDEEIAAASKELEPTPATPPANFSETVEFKAMQATIDAQKTALAELSARFADAEKKANAAPVLGELNEMVKAGRITPAEREKYEAQALKDLSAFTEYALPEIRKRDRALFSTGDVLKAKATFGDAGAQLTEMAQKRAAEKKISFSAALKEINRENPDLAQAHVNAAPVASKGGN